MADPQDIVVKIPAIAIPPADPAPNERELDLTIPYAELEGVQGVEDEPDTVLKVEKPSIPPVSAPEGNEPIKKKIIPLSGKLVTAEDPLIIGRDFRTLTNMEYGEAAPRSIPGMTKINASAMHDVFIKTRSAHQLKKVQPAETTPVESHILAQAYDTGFTASLVLQNTTAPPAQGAFSATQLWQDSLGAGRGRFSDAPGGQVAYANGVDACIWGGNGIPVSRFLVYDNPQTFLFDYTDAVNSADRSKVAYLSPDAVATGIDDNTVAVYHFATSHELEDSTTNGNDLTNVNVAFDHESPYYAGDKWPPMAWFDGSTAYLYAANDSTFDLSGGAWTIDLWVELYNGTYNPIYYHDTDVVKVEFSGGEHEPVVGETLTQDTTGATGVVRVVTVDSGAWGTSDAAGHIWLDTITGTWESSYDFDDPDTNTVATAGTCTTSKNYFHVGSVAISEYSDVIFVHIYQWESLEVPLTKVTYNVAKTYWHHIEVSENGDDWYLFIDGELIHSATSSVRPDTYENYVFLGYNPAVGDLAGAPYTNVEHFYYGFMDEVRISAVCCHSASFPVPESPYATSAGTTDAGDIYIFTPRPAQAFTFYLTTPNTAAATATAAVWDGSAFTELVIDDGTATETGTVTLGQTGTITFASTVGQAVPLYSNGTVGYCYKFTFVDVDVTTSIYHVTADCPFQPIVDLWDGADRSVKQFFLYKAAYQDFTVNVYNNNYVSTDPTTFVEMDSLTTAQYMEIGFTERMMAINFALVPGSVNSTAGTTATVYYWNGVENVTVGTISDGTSASSISFANPGIISWSPPSEMLEQKKSINGGPSLYFYKIVFSQNLSADVQLSYVSGITAQKSIGGYKFPVMSGDRLLLCNEVGGQRNYVKMSAANQPQVFNGDDSYDIPFGNGTDLTCGCNVFSQLSQTLYNITLLFKDRELWSLVPAANGGWQKNQISQSIGCNCPGTLRTATIPPIGDDKAGNRNIAIWVHASDGVFVSDGRHPVNVSYDIRDYFDQNAATHVNQSYAESYYAWVDQANLKYHLVLAVTTGTVTACDTEFVLDLRRWKWSVVDRTANLKLQCGIPVADAYGNNHTYGFVDTGYMERLNYGTTFDGQNIVSTFQTGDFPLIDGDLLQNTRLRGMALFMKAKTATQTSGALVVGTTYTIQSYQTNDDFTNVGAASNATGVVFTATGTTPTHWEHSSVLTPLVTLTHYRDSYATGTDYTSDPVHASYRLAFPVEPANSTPAVLHSFKGTITTGIETRGFEPQALCVFYQEVRDTLT